MPATRLISASSHSPVFSPMNWKRQVFLNHPLFAIANTEKLPRPSRLADMASLTKTADSTFSSHSTPLAPTPKFQHLTHPKSTLHSINWNGFLGGLWTDCMMILILHCLNATWQNEYTSFAKKLTALITSYLPTPVWQSGERSNARPRFTEFPPPMKSGTK